jgi:hypothetical protein
MASSKAATPDAYRAELPPGCRSSPKERRVRSKEEGISLAARSAPDAEADTPPSR